MSLHGREAEPGVAALLALAQIHRDVDDAAARGPLIAREYAGAQHLRLYGYEEGGSVIGLIGTEAMDELRATIRDLAVAPAARRRGIGRTLIDYLRCDLTSLEGHTLAPAIAFYERCGFTVREEGRMPDGKARYRFSWSAEARSNSSADHSGE